MNSLQFKVGAIAGYDYEKNIKHSGASACAYKCAYVHIFDISPPPPPESIAFLWNFWSDSLV